MTLPHSALMTSTKKIPQTFQKLLVEFYFDSQVLVCVNNLSSLIACECFILHTLEKLFFQIDTFIFMPKLGSFLHGKLYLKVVLTVSHYGSV